eukprot:3180462-Amphidinium_carterae.1
MWSVPRLFCLVGKGSLPSSQTGTGGYMPTIQRTTDPTFTNYFGKRLFADGEVTKKSPNHSACHFGLACMTPGSDICLQSAALTHMTRLFTYSKRKPVFFMMHDGCKHRVVAWILCRPSSN